MKISAVLILALAATAVAPVRAADRGSLEDQLACTPDVYQLCAGDIPDEDAVTACLRRNRPQLSAGCQAVFSRPDPAGAGSPAKGG